MSDHQLLAPAKINLSLQILDRRPDGYHNLNSWMHKLTLADRLNISIERQGRGEVKLQCVAPDDLSTLLPANIADNICVRAAQSFLTLFSLNWNVDIKLTKQIPIGAGMGGGSSDAAATLRVLCAEMSADADQMNIVIDQIARPLGADITFLFLTTFAKCEGIGEIVHPHKPLPAYPTLLLKPEFSINTAAAYRDLAKARQTGTFTELTQAMTWLQDECIKKRSHAFSEQHELGELVNDFVPVVLHQQPTLGELIAGLWRTPCLYADMTGSGSTLFAIYENANQRSAALSELQSLQVYKDLAVKAYLCELAQE